MTQDFPEPQIFLRAVSVFLDQAYLGSQPSPTVRKLVDSLNQNSAALYDNPAIIKSKPGEPIRYTLRLGNRFYQHMKFVLEQAPDGHSVIFRSDTHDRHLCPAADHPEYAQFMVLRENNQTVATAIDQAWADAGIPTFKTYLRDDLARRKAAAEGHNA